MTFRATGPGGIFDPLGSVVGGGFPDASVNGETAEDRFFGVTNAAGISSISISNTSGGIEVDHLQYGLAGPVTEPIPEPGTLLLLGSGLLGLAGYGRSVARSSQESVASSR